MGEVEIDPYHDTIIITSHIISYGNAVDEKVTSLIREEIETMWNEPKGTVYLQGNKFMVTFSISAELHPDMEGMDESIRRLAGILVQSSPEAMAEMKKLFWKGTEYWDKLLIERAAISGRLILSEFSKTAIEKFKKK